MKKKLIQVLKYLLVYLIFIFLFIVPTVLIPVSPSLLERINPEEMENFFPLLLLFAFYMAGSYWLVINNSDQKKMALFVKLSAANFLLYPLMGLIESLFWLDTLGVVENEEFIKIFFRFFITFILFSAFLSLIHKGNGISGETKSMSVSYKSLSRKLLIIGAIYILIYNVFGYFVAWQFEATRVYYSGSSELKGFFTMLSLNLIDYKFVIVHFSRGILFGISGYIFYTLLNCSYIKKALILALVFGGFGMQIVLPNPIFPEMVRISHFIETTSSMIVFGFVVGLVFSHQKKRIGVTTSK